MLGYDLTGLGLENVGPDGKMLDLAEWIMLDSEWNMLGYAHSQLWLGNVGFSWIMLDCDWNILRYDHTWAGKCWI